jgi:hypothetical protein
MKNKLYTFTFCEKNGNAVIIFDTYSEDDAIKILEEKVKYPKEWRLETKELTYQ